MLHCNCQYEYTSAVGIVIVWTRLKEVRELMNESYVLFGPDIGYYAARIEVVKVSFS